MSVTVEIKWEMRVKLLPRLFTDIGRDPTFSAQIPEERRGPGLNAVPLYHADGRKLMFLIEDEETLGYVSSLVREALEPAGYWVRLDCGAFGIGLAAPNQKEISSFLDSLRCLLNAEVIAGSEEPAMFSERMQVDGDTAVCDAEIAKVDNAFLALSLIFRAGVLIFHVSTHPLWTFQRFALEFGPEEQPLGGFQGEQVEKVAQTIRSQRAINAAQMLRGFFAQTNKLGRLAVGWPIMESLFWHIGDERTIIQPRARRTLFRIAKCRGYVEKADIDRLRQVLVESDLFRARTRNRIIAESIADHIGLDVKIIRDRITALAEKRGKLLHGNPQDSDISIEVEEEFIKEAMWSYIARNQ